MREVDAFVRGRPPAVRRFRVIYLLLTLNFAIPVTSYLVDRAATERFVSALDVALGGPPIVETGALWHMLAIGNVATLAFLCAAMWLDLRRWIVALPALVFLKATSALVSLGIAVTQGLPAFFAVFVLDGVTSIVMATSARSAWHAMEGTVPPPMWSYLLVFPRAIDDGLRRVAASGRLARTPTLAEVGRGVLRMWGRILFRSSTVGTSRARVRATLRARIFALRPVRVFVLLWERAIAPLDLSGLASPPDRVVRHVLGAHLDGLQLLYDLELLSLHPGWLERLRDAAAEVANEATPRARFLADLCVFEGYHAEVATMTASYLAGEPVGPPEALADPDLSLFAHLAWCAGVSARASSPAPLSSSAPSSPAPLSSLDPAGR